MQPAPTPTSKPSKPALRSHRRRYLGLALTAFVAGVFGLGVGSALRFRIVPSVAENRLSPEQAFPPLADWPPEAPRASHLKRDLEASPARRLLPAAEAATSRPASTSNRISDTTPATPTDRDDSDQAVAPLSSPLPLSNVESETRPNELEQSPDLEALVQGTLENPQPLRNSNPLAAPDSPSESTGLPAAPTPLSEADTAVPTPTLRLPEKARPIAPAAPIEDAPSSENTADD
ncbi:MAG: hypothetical protein AAFU71_00390 [Cyanobacteria bacterium J06632_22]